MEVRQMIHKYRSLLLSLMTVLLTVLLIAPSAAQEPCIGDPECYEEPTPGRPQRRESNRSSGPRWSGFNDGRLTPQPDEYYSLWCKHTFLEIWRGVPEGSLLQFVPIWLLDALDENGGTATIPNYGLTPFTITRWGDTINIAGNYGNLQPAAGDKSFSLSECITRNDGPIGDPPPNHNASQAQVGMLMVFTSCYGRDSEVARRGLVPPDQICNEGGNTRMELGIP
jgi:hypothetical protein